MLRDWFEDKGTYKSATLFSVVIERRGDKREVIESCVRFFTLESVVPSSNAFALPLNVVAFNRFPISKTHYQTPYHFSTFILDSPPFQDQSADEKKKKMEMNLPESLAEV